MCLLAFAWRVHPQYPLVLAGNRDEFHDRPAEAARWWDEPEGILAGRDLQAGGSWLGVNRGGRFAVVTNYREPGVATSGRRSRGELVVAFLASSEPVVDWLDALNRRQDEYGGFNLIIGDGEQLHYLSNRGEDRRFLDPGIYGLSNHRLDTPWPKVATARAGLQRLVERDRVRCEELFQLLADRTPAAESELPDTGVPLQWERLLSSVFIVDPRYGTRVSTVVLIGTDGQCRLEERRFNPEGQREGEARFSFAPSPPAARS
jgi:uncharacterized protein with NRDE domain